MKRIARLPVQLSAAPAAILVTVALLLLAGIAVILQGEADTREAQAQEVRVQAEILAAGVSAALDFGDAAAAQEAADALRVSPRVRAVGIYDATGRRIAGHGRADAQPPARIDQPWPMPASLITASAPVVSGEERVGAVFLAAEAEPLSRRLARYLVVVLLVMMAVLVVIVLGIAQRALRRANRELEERAGALAAANAELRVQIEERARAEDELRQAHKLQALGQLTGGIAHDFNNLLTVIQGSADMLRRPGLDESKKARMAEAIVQASSRAAALTGQLLAFARRQPLQPEIIAVNRLIGEMIDLLDRTLGERIAIRTALAEDACTVEADRAQLESALLNIAVNARDAMPEGGDLTIGTTRVEREGQDMVGIFVRDTGVGMDADTLARAIEPFFTTKATGKGTGLGLSQVYGFATQSGGDVGIASTPEDGTTVTLFLPCTGAEARAAETAAEIGRLQHGRGGRVLLVEDNEDVGEFAAILLGELGHEVVRAGSGAQALEIAARERFDAVFSDVVMPGMSGLELADALGRTHPDLPVILTTGYSDEIAQSGAGGRPVILKPYRLEALAEALDQALAPGAAGE